MRRVAQRQLAFDLRQVARLHLGAGGEERRWRWLRGGMTPLTISSWVCDVQLAQFADGSPRFVDGDGLGVQHEGEARLRRVAHHRPARARTCAWRSGSAAAGPMQVWPLPCAGGVDSTGSTRPAVPAGAGVWPVGAVSKIDDVELLLPIGCVVQHQKIGKAVEGGHFGGAGAAHLLFHHLHHLRRKGGAQGRHRAVDVLLGRLVGVDLHRPQVGARRRVGVIWWPISCSKTSARLEAGSVVTISVRFAFIGVIQEP